MVSKDPEKGSGHTYPSASAAAAWDFNPAKTLDERAFSGRLVANDDNLWQWQLASFDTELLQLVHSLD